MEVRIDMRSTGEGIVPATLCAVVIMAATCIRDMNETKNGVVRRPKKESRSTSQDTAISHGDNRSKRCQKKGPEPCLKLSALLVICIYVQGPKNVYLV